MKPTQLACGLGTVRSGDVCVPIEAGVGEGGAAGTSGHSGGAGEGQDASASWGGGAGSGGANTAGAGTDAGDDSADVGPPDGPGEADAPAEAAPVTDDPCPSGDIEVNCADDCGGKTANCSTVTCLDTSADYSPVRVDDYGVPFVIRTPSHPGVHPDCLSHCGPDGVVYSMKVLGPCEMPLSSTGATMTVRTEWPWFIEIKQNLLKPCISGATLITGCSEETYSPESPYTSCHDILIATRDPDAPARNVYVDIEPLGQGCP